MQTILNYFNEISLKIADWGIWTSVGSIGFIVLSILAGLIVLTAALWVFSLSFKAENLAVRISLAVTLGLIILVGLVIYTYLIVLTVGHIGL